MSDIRARLLDALLNHRFPASLTGLDAGVVADVLLSLPGIAIVELPTQRLGPLAWPQTFTPHELAPAEMRYFAAKLLAAANAAEMAPQ